MYITSVSTSMNLSKVQALESLTFHGFLNQPPWLSPFDLSMHFEHHPPRTHEDPGGKGQAAVIESKD